jgi:hypothetical protein
VQGIVWMRVHGLNSIIDTSGMLHSPCARGACPCGAAEAMITGEDG